MFVGLMNWVKQKAIYDISAPMDALSPLSLSLMMADNIIELGFWCLYISYIKFMYEIRICFLMLVGFKELGKAEGNLSDVPVPSLCLNIS